MRWRVPLLGNDLDLRRLVKAHPGHDLRVVWDERLGFLLEGQRFEHMNDSEAVFCEASAVLESMNGIGRLLYGAAPVRAAAPYELTPDGKTIAAATAMVTMRMATWFEATIVSRGNGTEEAASEPRVSDSARLLDLAETDAAIRAALTLFGAGDGLNWARMYSLLEIIEGDARDIRRIADLCGVAHTAIANLRRTACAPDVLGVLEARHGVQQYAPPPNPMTLDAARAIATRMLCAWIDTKTAGRP